MPAEEIDELLQKNDPDRRLAALFAPEEQRERLFVLYAFNQDIARIAEATSQSLIGEMKLTWWRDAIEDLYAPEPKVRRHAVTEGLDGLRNYLSRDDLMELIEARFDDVSARPFVSLDDLLAYVDATSVGLMRLALRLCHVELPDGQVLSAGRAWGLAGLLRAFPHRAAIGRAPVAGDRLTELGGSAAMMAQGLGQDKAALARAEIIEAARAADAEFRAHGALPAAAVPAIGYAILARGYLKQLPENPYQIAAEPSLIARQLRLSWLSMTGR